MIEIGLSNIEKSYGSNKILDNITFELYDRDRLALVGKNGSGKTTILKIIAKLENYDNGNIFYRKNITISYFDQIPSYNDHYSSKDILFLAFKEIIALRKKMITYEKMLENNNFKDMNHYNIILEKYGELQSEYEYKNGYEIDSKVKAICKGLKISSSMLSKKFNILSGGEKSKILLAKMLLQESDILLLDEPTNHLDVESLEWLEGFIKDYQGAIILISHDRYFLDNVITSAIEIEEKKSKTYLGNYTQYLQEKKQWLESQILLYKSQEKKIEKMEEALARFKDWANRGNGNEKMAKKAKNMEKRISRINKIDKPKSKERKIDLTFNKNSSYSNEILKIENLSKSYNGEKLLSNVSFLLRHGERAVLLGKNGCGKTTLIKIIANEERLDSGKVKLGSNIKIGYLKQDIVFCNENHFVLQEFLSSYSTSNTVARSILAKFLFLGDDVFKKVSNLSGGERVRLRLCQLMYDNIDFLILDEPSNHLDINSREILEKAMKNFSGAILFISHDRYLINKIANTVFEIDNKKIYEYSGNYEYYKNKKKTSNKPIKDIISKNKKRKYKKTSLKKINTFKLKEVEDKISYLELESGFIKRDMEKNSRNSKKLLELYKKLELMKKELEILYEEWDKISTT